MHDLELLASIYLASDLRNGGVGARLVVSSPMIPATTQPEPNRWVLALVLDNTFAKGTFFDVCFVISIIIVVIIGVSET